MKTIPFENLSSIHMENEATESHDVDIFISSSWFIHSFIHSVPSKIMWVWDIMHILMNQLFDFSHSIQQALRVWESARVLWCIKSLSAAKTARIPDCCAFSLRKMFVLLSNFPLQTIFLLLRTNTNSQIWILLWIKTLHSPISEFIEVSREAVGKRFNSG